MKIISKYKDYYDHLQGIWGMDEKLVLDRTNFVVTPEYTTTMQCPHLELIRFYLCGNIVEGVYHQEKALKVGEFLFGEDIERVLHHRIDTTDSRTSFRKDSRYYYIKMLNGKWWNHSFRVLKQPTPFFDLDHSPTGFYKNITKVECPNDLFNCPILIEQKASDKEFSPSKCERFPILKDYSMHKVYSAQDMWIMLGEWLGREKIIPNNQTNNEKVLSNGFDLKTSFRNPIK